MKPAVLAWKMTVGLGVLLAQSATYGVEPPTATATAAGVSTTQAGGELDLMPAGGRGAWVVIRGMDVIGPKTLDGSEPSRSGLREALRDLKAGEPSMVLVASEITLHCDGENTRIAASDCNVLMSGKRGNLRGTAATAQIDLGASRMSLGDAEIHAGLYRPGSDLDKAVSIRAESIDFDFAAPNSELNHRLCR